jgi:hypothetical protein
VLAGTLAFGWGVAASAHEPYEMPAAVLVDSSGERFNVVKRYTDGIVFTDPVRLVVRNAQGATVAETDAGRDISLLCPTERRCVAFRYDGLMPVVPEDVWWLEGSEVRKAQSVLLTLAGVVVPLWDHWLGYLLALGFLWVPLVALRRAWARPTTAVNGVLLVVVGLSASGIWLACLYVVVLLSYLSLPLVAALSLGVSFVGRRLRRRRAAPSLVHERAEERAAQQADAADEAQGGTRMAS